MRIIFSVYQKTQSNRVNKSNHAIVKRQLNGQLIKETIGYYDGEEELSFLVRVNGPEDIGRIMTICKEFNQESYLVLHESTDEAEVIECGTGDVLLSGDWSLIKNPMDYIGWTKVGNDYYTIKMGA